MIDKRKLAHDLTDLMARLLHYQQHGEPDIATLTYAEAVRVPDEIVARYRNEPIFHAQVQRAVASVLHLVTDAERDAVRVTVRPLRAISPIVESSPETTKPA